MLDTVLLDPDSRAEIAFVADNPGTWIDGGKDGRDGIDVFMRSSALPATPPSWKASPICGGVCRTPACLRRRTYRPSPAS